MATQTLSFYTLGPEFTSLIRNFVTEGSFYQAYEILKDGGAPDEYIKSFFLFTSEFTGDSRDDTFAIGFCKPVYETVEKLNRQYYYAIRTMMTQAKYDDEDHELDTYLELDFRGLKRTKNRNYLSLLKVFSEEEIFSMILPYTDINKDYSLTPELKDNDSPSAVIANNGAFIQCEYQGHRELYPHLFAMGLSDDPCWTDSKDTFHISSGELSGGCARGLSHPDFDKNCLPNQAQLNTLFRYRKNLRMYGNRNNSVVKEILEYEAFFQNHGGKYNNLFFLSKYYPELNLPAFSKEPLDIDNQCIRTSPKYSMPGLLNSKFEITEDSIKEIEADFAKYGDKFGTPGNKHYQNELHYFYQEFLEGANGVAHYRGDNQKKFTYSLSKSQGDIVQGKESSLELSYSLGVELEGICKMLSDDLGESIQVEFVISGNKIYIVQLRMLKTEPVTNSREYDKDDILYKGKSFSIGYIPFGKWTPEQTEFELKNVLVIDDDAEDSSLLLGKDALIVKKDIEFSHMLALSKALNIPSIYAVGDVDLPEKFRIDATEETGVILKSKL